MFDSLFPKEWTTLQRLMWLKTNALARAVYETVTGNPVSFTAKAAPLRQLSVAFSPKQDLHGYDAPWPAGGGKNKLDSSFCLNRTVKGIKSVVNADGSITLTGTSDGTARYWNSSDTMGLVLSVGTYTLSEHLRLEIVGGRTYSGTFTLTEETTFQNVQIVGFSSGETVNVTLYPQLEAGSTATAYSPYSNICPISGFDSVTVNRTGKNLYYYDATKATTGETTAGKIRGYYPLGLRNCTLTFSASLIEGETPTPGNINIGKLSNGKLSVLNDFLTPSAIRQRTFTFAADEEAVLMSVSTNTGGITDKLPHYNIMVEIGETAHDYEAYNGTSISISLGSTVYSGTLDLVTGVGEITSIADVYDGDESEYWEKFGSGSASAYAMRGHLSATRKAGAVAKANYLKYVETNAPWGNYNAFVSFQTIGEAVSVITGIKTITTVSDWKAYLANNPLTICYELATPIPIQLTPQEVESLAGDNTLWSDANQPLTVTYRSN